MVLWGPPALLVFGPCPLRPAAVQCCCAVLRMLADHAWRLPGACCCLPQPAASQLCATGCARCWSCLPTQTSWCAAAGMGMSPTHVSTTTPTSTQVGAWAQASAPASCTVAQHAQHRRSTHSAVQQQRQRLFSVRSPCCSASGLSACTLRALQAATSTAITRPRELPRSPCLPPQLINCCSAFLPDQALGGPGQQV